MKLNSKKIVASFSIIVLLLGLAITLIWKGEVDLSAIRNIVWANSDKGQPDEKSDLVGPGDNLPLGAPKKKEFKNFAVPAPGVFSRSGRLTIDNLKWLRKNGWKSVVDLRVDGEHLGSKIDAGTPSFSEVGLNFLNIPIKDGGIPSGDQADEFLRFVSNPEDQPVHVHCRAGVGRAGVATVLYRYSVEGWPMDKAIDEMLLFRDKDLNKKQQEFLSNWAKNHAPGSYYVN